MIKLGKIYKVKNVEENPFIPKLAIPVRRLTDEEYKKLIEPYISIKYNDKEVYYMIWNIETSDEEHGLWTERHFVMNYEELK